MRLRTLVVTVLWLGAIGYGAFVLLAAGSSWFQTSGLIEQAVQGVARRAGSPGPVETGGPGYASDVRGAILFAARRQGIPLDPKNLTVSPEGPGVRVRLHWSYPALSLRGETVLAVPLWIDRSYGGSPAIRR
jgi:hypothetical protein